MKCSCQGNQCFSGTGFAGQCYKFDFRAGTGLKYYTFRYKTKKVPELALFNIMKTLLS
jgi:hypothetical protein